MPESFALIFCVAAVLWFVSSSIYQIWFHRLSHIPGPKRGAVSALWSTFYAFRGNLHNVILDLHTRYGPVVRIGPNAVSFSSGSSWKAIYGFRAQGDAPFTKTAFYDAVSTQRPELRKKSIITERNLEYHSSSRKLMSHAFSARALAQQEPLVRRFADLLVQKIVQIQGDEASDGIEMGKWYTFFAFDVIGKLAMGESFGCLETGEPHFFVEFFMNHFRINVTMNFLSHYPRAMRVVRKLLPPTFKKLAMRQRNYVQQMTYRRIKTKTNDKDFMTEILQKRLSDEQATDEELAGHASALIAAGSETISTFFTIATYYIAKSPTVHRRVTAEVRSRYNTADQINANSLTTLPYLQATIDECLRICPPVSAGLPRVSPGEIVDGIYLPPGTEVYTHAWSAVHDPENFEKPYEFRPERWLEMSKDRKDAHQPFSTGPHGCLGVNLAWMEMRLLLAVLLFKFDFELVNKELVWERDVKNFIIWMKPELWVRFRHAQEAGEK